MICSATICHTGGVGQNLDSPAERLKWARARAGFEDAASFARAMKLPPVSYRAYEAGQNGFAKHAPTFAKKLGVTLEWLLEGGDLPEGGSPIVPQPPSLEEFAAEHGLALVEQVDLALGMGATYLDGNKPEVLGIVPFRADWLRGLHEGPIERLKVVSGRGDSMEPTIRDGDIVLVDTAQRRIDDQDRIWAIAYGELGMIRRVRVTPRGTWMLMPDNGVVRPDEVGDGEVAVIGRVIWIGRRI